MLNKHEKKNNIILIAKKCTIIKEKALMNVDRHHSKSLKICPTANPSLKYVYIKITSQSAKGKTYSANKTTRLDSFCSLCGERQFYFNSFYNEFEH